MSFHHLNVIPWFECHSIIWMLFHHLNVIQSFECHSIICMSFYHLNVIPSFECHFIIWMSFHHLNVISSFECHSIICMSFHHFQFISTLHYNSDGQVVCVCTFFRSPPEHSHSSPFCHSFVIWECPKWQRMKVTRERYHSRTILVICTSFQAVLSSKNDDGMMGWGEMRNIF